MTYVCCAQSFYNWLFYLTCILQENTTAKAVSEENRTTIVRSLHENSESNKEITPPPISVDELTTAITSSNTTISTPMDTTNTELYNTTTTTTITTSSSVILRNIK